MGPVLVIGAIALTFVGRALQSAEVIGLIEALIMYFASLALTIVGGVVW